MWKCYCKTNNLLLNTHCRGCGMEMPGELRLAIYRQELHKIKVARYKKMLDELKLKLTTHSESKTVGTKEAQRISSNLFNFLLRFSHAVVVPIAVVIIILTIAFSTQIQHSYTADTINNTTIATEEITTPISVESVTLSFQSFSKSLKDIPSHINPEMKIALSKKVSVILNNAYNFKNNFPQYLQTTIEELKKKWN